MTGDTRSPVSSSIRAVHDNWPSMIVGPYSIGPCVHGGWWIENADGEGMQVRSEILVKALDAFWKENF